MSDNKVKVDLDGFWLGLFIMIAAVMLFWYTKIDCAIGVERACQIIADSYGADR